MKRLVSVISALTILCYLLFLPALVNASNEPDLVISQFKITSNDGQFFMLYNTTDQTIDMGLVQLVYYNSYNLSAATSSKIIQLSGQLEPKSYYLVNDGPLTLCYRMIVNSVSLGLSSTAGAVQVQRLTQNNPGSAVTSQLQDYVSWTKTTVSGVQKLPASTKQFLLRQPQDSSFNPLISSPGQGSWQTVEPSTNNPCSLTTTQVIPAQVQTNMLMLSSTPPPVTIISIAASTTGPYMPAENIGLMAPIVNELSPNPKSPQTDADDEFIELYNPNSKSFNLTGFSLGTGINRSYKKKFADGTKLPPKSFTAFFSSGTNLALSNTGSQARLIDPFDNVISKSKEYSNAKEGQTWALANNDWYWTNQPTPNAANVINGGSTATSSTGNKNGAVQGTSTETSNETNGGSAPHTPAQVATLHPSTLAGVTTLALGYGAYEYRQDIANRVRQFRSHRATRRNSGA